MRPATSTPDSQDYLPRFQQFKQLKKKRRSDSKIKNHCYYKGMSERGFVLLPLLVVLSFAIVFSGAFLTWRQLNQSNKEPAIKQVENTKPEFPKANSVFNKNLKECVGEISDKLFPQKIENYLYSHKQNAKIDPIHGWRSPTGSNVKVEKVAEVAYYKDNNHLMYINIARYSSRDDFLKFNQLVTEYEKVFEQYPQWKNQISFSDNVIAGANVLMSNQKGSAVGYLHAAIPENMTEVSFKFDAQLELNEYENIFKEWIAKACN